MDRLRRLGRTCLVQCWAIAALIGTGVVVATVSLGAEDPSTQQPYLVWWSSSFGLERLDDLDAHMARTFWPDGSFKVHESHREDSPVFFITDGDTMATAVANGYWARANVMVQFSWLIECWALERLRDARPAAVSHIRTFVFTDDAVNRLPAMLISQGSCDAQCRIVTASGQGRTIGQHEPDIVFVDAVNQESLQIRTYRDWIYIDILARGDFTADGADDILVRAKVHAVGTRWSATDLFVLSRDTADGLIRVADPESYLCLDYTC